MSSHSDQNSIYFKDQLNEKDEAYCHSNPSFQEEQSRAPQIPMPSYREAMRNNLEF